MWRDSHPEFKKIMVFVLFWFPLELRFPNYSRQCGCNVCVHRLLQACEKVSVALGVLNKGCVYFGLAGAVAFQDAQYTAVAFLAAQSMEAKPIFVAGIDHNINKLNVKFGVVSKHCIATSITKLSQ